MLLTRRALIVTVDLYIDTECPLDGVNGAVTSSYIGLASWFTLRPFKQPVAHAADAGSHLLCIPVPSLSFLSLFSSPHIFSHSRFLPLSSPFPSLGGMAVLQRLGIAGYDF